MEEMTYNEFIQNILDTRGRFECEEGIYKERHHIVPKCMDGGDENENLIDLYAEEHYEAHRLLALENPNNKKLTYAWACMAWVESDTHERYQLTPEEYAEVRAIYVKMMSEKMSGENNHMYGRTHSEDTRKKISEAAIRSCGAPERRKQLSEQAKNQWKNDEYREQKRQIAKNMWNNDEYREKRIACLSLRVGDKNPFFGKHHSEDTKEIIRQKRIRKKATDESKEKMSQSQLARWTDELREEWGAKFSGEGNGMYGKTHTNDAKDRIGELNGITVVQLDTNGNFIAEYRSSKMAEKITGINRNSIRRCCNNAQKTAGGYQWKEKEDWLKLQSVIQNELEVTDEL